ncbi:MAG: hypothetical protein GY793_06820 [Proteobacteria bacterium]|nr:hypothetical protein [Pseudomonadota bacterium]
MLKKKSFILDMPYSLASPVGNLFSRAVYATCYIVLILGYYVEPLIGTVLASCICLVIWQVFNIVTKHDDKHRIYNNFLLQRLAFCLLAVITIFIYILKDGFFNYDLWRLLISILAIINFTDVLLSLKGMIGLGYISYGNKD